MAKKMWFTAAPTAATAALVHRGNNDTKLNGTASWWRPFRLSEAQGTNGGAYNMNVNTVAGPTNGVEVLDAAALEAEWISEPLSADFTISGTITCNLWVFEATMNDNVAANVIIERIDATTLSVAQQIVKTARVTEEALTTSTVANFTATPTSTACNRGDRLRVRVFADDAGTMGAGGSMTFSLDRATVGSQGDSWIQFTENLTFETIGDPVTRSQPDHGITNNLGFNASTQRVAQSFVAAGTPLTAVQVWLAKTGSPTDNVIVEIQSDSAGVPSGTSVGSVGTTLGSGLASSTAAVTYSGLSIALVSGNTYWIVLSRSGAVDGSNFYPVGMSGGGVAAPGWTIAQTYNGSTWANVSLIGSMTVALTYFVSTYYLTDTASPVPALTEFSGATATTSFGDGTLVRQGQSFMALGGNLTEVRLWLRKTGAPTDNVVIEIQADSAGSPSGTTLASVATVAGTALTTTLAQYTYSCSIALTAGTIYWLVLSRSAAADAANFYTLGDGLASGTQWPYAAKSFNGTVWNPLITIGPMTWTHRVTFSVFQKGAATTRGGGSTTVVTNTAAGPVTPIQATAAGGGATVEWYTPPLNAVTFGGKAKFNVRAKEGANTTNASIRAEIAVCNSDGTGAVAWGAGNHQAIVTFGSFGEIAFSADTAHTVWVAGDDTAIASQQRLRFRLFVDDCADVPLVTGGTVTFSYNGTTAAAAGDSYVMLPVVVTEAGPPAKSLVAPMARQQMRQMTRWF